MSGSSAVAAVPRAARELLQSDLGGCLNPVGKVLRTLEDTAKRSGATVTPRLVAVTKTHGVEKVHWGYHQGLRHFGENYLQELREKSNAVKGSCTDIKWHYLGRIFRNKVKILLDCPGLWMVETLSKCSTAQALNRCWGLREASCPPLKVMVQVNTSSEENKLGCSPEELGELVQYLLKECPHLDLRGLMTIGRFGHDPQLGRNPDFAALAQSRDYLASTHQLPLELSMGMSADYQHAIEMGSTSVRVGTALFGPRGAS